MSCYSNNRMDINGIFFFSIVSLDPKNESSTNCRSVSNDLTVADSFFNLHPG